MTPLDRSASTEEVVSFADGLAVVLAARHPDELTVAFHKADRGDRLYLDTARNGYAQTAVSPYSVRPRAGAPVATPLEWDELDDPAFRPDGWTIKRRSRTAWPSAPTRGRRCPATPAPSRPARTSWQRCVEQAR